MILLTDLLKESTDITYQLKDLGDDDFKVVAMVGNNSVGTLTFTKSQFSPKLIGTTLSVDPEFRRRGIASGMYEFAEEELGIKFVRSDAVLTPDGKALWDNPNRKFGK
jgi:predicted N-acetyltransferase YhbS